MTTEPASRGTPRRAGLPRSETTRRNILEATIHLPEDGTVQSLTIEAIARGAGMKACGELTMQIAPPPPCAIICCAAARIR